MAWIACASDKLAGRMVNIIFSFDFIIFILNYKKRGLNPLLTEIGITSMVQLAWSISLGPFDGMEGF